MAAEEEALPQLLILKPPSLFSDFQYKFSPKFQLLKAWESPLPTTLFLTTHAHSVKAVVSSSSSPITSDILRHLPSLQLVVATTVGLNQIDLPECRRRGISIANAGKILSEDCADMGVGLFIDVLKKISAGDRFVRSGLWPIQKDFPLGSKAWESPLPKHLCLTTYAYSVTVLLCSPRSPISSFSFPLSGWSSPPPLASTTLISLSVINVGGSNVLSADGADLAMGLFIDLHRKVLAADRFLCAGFWPMKREYPLSFKLGGKRVGIVGLGSIGLEVAKRLEAFGCIILYNSRRKKANISYPFYSNVCELAANSNALIICCALTDETRHMINKEVMKALGKEGVIINIGRGAIIDEKELVQCLVQGEIGGAGLDVFENEPDVPKELFTLDNVVLSPHVAVFTQESFSDLYDLMVGNLEAFFSNKTLLSPVLDE
uniref:glyoxylate reductase (NADP(+)) n=1 Tax=Vitis vinifera TaxID=29760 RepID=A5BY55_VITVI|nr:hypothetical protein VITISV_006350 [Vitis vinifera]